MRVKELVLLKINLCNVIPFSSRREIFSTYYLSSAGTTGQWYWEWIVYYKNMYSRTCYLMHRNDLDNMKLVAPFIVHPVMW